VHYGYPPRPSLFDASYRERYDVAANALPGEQKYALHQFVLADALLGAPGHGAADWPPRDAGISAASMLLQRYGDLSEGLRQIPPAPRDARPVLMPADPKLLDCFAAGDVVWNGCIPLSATTDGHTVATVFKRQEVAGMRAEKDPRLMFMIHGATGRPLIGALAKRAHDEAGQVFLPGTRFRVGSVTWAEPRQGLYTPLDIEPEVRFLSANRPPLQIVELIELPPSGPLQYLPAKNLRTGQSEHALRADLFQDRLTALILSDARIRMPNARGMYKLPGGAKLAPVDGEWRVVRHSPERAQWEQFDRRRPRDTGARIERVGPRGEWRTASRDRPQGETSLDASLDVSEPAEAVSPTGPRTSPAGCATLTP